jgi:hypothetical protein
MMPAQRSDRLVFIFLRFEVLRYNILLAADSLYVASAWRAVQIALRMMELNSSSRMGEFRSLNLRNWFLNL